jgi:hypothetical protein
MICFSVYKLKHDFTEQVAKQVMMITLQVIIIHANQNTEETPLNNSSFKVFPHWGWILVVPSPDILEFNFNHVKFSSV